MKAPTASTGVVLRLEKSSVYDGAGLRTVVFLKGCHLRCRWCSTPESQDTRLELGIDPVLCTGCGLCLKGCPLAARRREDDFIRVDKALCQGCLCCVTACPQQAITVYGRRMDAQEVLAEVLKDEVFYFHSGGGITISGGEPLLQAAFVAELLRGCRAHGINTALETAFVAPWSQAETVLPYVDTLFADIKHSDSKQHRLLTGRGNGEILENIRRADAAPWPLEITLRLPLIPGLNDDEDNLRRTAEFALTLQKLKGLQLLQYHRLGSATYAKLGRDYELQHIPLPDAAYMEQKYAYLRQFAPQLPLI